MFTKHGKTLRILLVLSFAFLLYISGLWTGFFFRRIDQSTPINLRESYSGHRLINPLLLFDISNTEALQEYSQLKQELSHYVSDQLSSQNAQDISIYFRDLNSGQWTGVNEDQIYSPASMLKVATLISVLRKSENDPSLLSKNIYFDPKSKNLDTLFYYPPQNPIKLGSRYTTQELLDSMIIDSDNNAMALLTELVGDDSVLKVYKDLRLPLINSENFKGISPKDYSRLYRILYNSTYLSHALSEQTLTLLTKTRYTNGIVAGIPAGITVAHKFGERISNGNDNELHDCGIVYTTQPYFLCIMTRGNDFKKLESIIEKVSRIVWTNEGKSAVNQ